MRDVFMRVGRAALAMLSAGVVVTMGSQVHAQQPAGELRVGMTAAAQADGSVWLHAGQDETRVEYRLSPNGGTLTHVRMLADRFTRDAFPVLANVPDDKVAAGPIDLVSTWDAAYLPYRLVFRKLEGAGEVTRVLRKGTNASFRGGRLVTTDGALNTLDRPILTGDRLVVRSPEAVAGSYTVRSVGLEGDVSIDRDAPLPDVIGVEYQIDRRGHFKDLFDQDPTYTQVSPEGEFPIVYVWPDPRTDTSTMFIEKRFEPSVNAYTLALQVRIFNLARDRSLEVLTGLRVVGWQHPANIGGGIFEFPTNLYGADCMTADGMEREEFPSLVDEPAGLSFPAAPSWIGVDTRYTLMAAVPINKPEALMGQCAMMANTGGVISTTWWARPEKIKPATCVPNWRAPEEGQTSCDLAGETSRRVQGLHEFRLYNGIKDIDLLHASGKFSFQGEIRDAQLEQGADSGFFGTIGAILHQLMRWIFQFVGDWALAIVLMTVAIKLLLLPLTNKSFSSMQKMQALKPKMDELKERYGDDKEAMNKEMMALYKREKVNPLGGCLPMVIQMPIWIALYQTIYSAAELYHTPLGMWVTDLSAPDPYYVMPILLGLLMVAQSFFTPTASGMDATQAKIMKYGMPVMFSFMMLFLPSGLVLYILVNTVLTLVQNIIIRRRLA